MPPPRRLSPRATPPSRSPRARTPVRALPRGRGPGPNLRFASVRPEQISAYADLVAGSYPLFFQDHEKSLEGFREILKLGVPQFYGAFEPDGRVVGSYAYYEFAATLLGRGIPASGLGLVATALDKKKQHIALAIVRDFVQRTRRRGIPLSLLYPFRHDFYADMGWGAVGQAKQYYVRPSALPLYPQRRDVVWVRQPEVKLLDTIHRQFVGKQGGLGLSRRVERWGALLHQAQQVFVVGAPKTPEGYLLARFVKREGDADKFRYDLEVIEMEWTTPRAMRALLGFLSSQRDQVLEVILNWPPDGDLDAILRDPARVGAPRIPGHQCPGGLLAHGVMLRLEDPAQAFHLRPYRGPDALSLAVVTRDPLFPGRPNLFRALLRGDAAEGVRARPARLEVDLATLSRLWAGALRFSEAADFGLIEVSPPSAVAALDRLLAAPRPWVVERF